MVLHVGCTVRRCDASVKRKAPQILGEKGLHDSLSTTGDVLCSRTVWLLVRSVASIGISIIRVWCSRAGPRLRHGRASAGDTACRGLVDWSTTARGRYWPTV